MPILGPVPVEEDLIRSLGLTAFDGGGDWHLTADGDIGLTRDGDFAVGDASFNAMCRLIGAWRFSVPAMRLMFDTIIQTREARPGLDADLEQSLQSDTPWILKRTQEQLDAYHSTNDAIYASEVGTAALAGSLLLLAATLLGRFKADANATLAEWKEAGPQIRGHSVGRLVWAAGNAFRHTDEWAEARHSGTFTGQQKASMNILRDATRPDPTDVLDRPEWEVALDVLSGGSLDGLTANVLRFADDVAVRARARRSSPEKQPS